MKTYSRKPSRSSKFIVRCSQFDVLLLLMLVAFTLPARANLLLNEPFDYPVATVLDDAATPWLADASLGDYIQVVANNLSVPGLAPPSGRSVQYGGGGRSSSRTFGTQTSGTLYYSLALRLDNTNFTDQDIAVALNASYATLWLRPASNAFQVGLHFSSGTGGGHDPLYAPNLFQAGQTIFLVAAYQFVAGNTNDVVSLWVNPSPTSFGAANAPSPTLTETNYSEGIADRTSLRGLDLRQGRTAGFATLTADEVRVGTNWADVTPPASANTPAIVWANREHAAGVTSVAFSSDKQFLASGSEDSTVRLWRIAGDERPVVLSGHTGRVAAVAFSPESDLLASAGGDGLVKLWMVGQTNPPRTLSGHSGPVNALAFSPSGSRLVSGGDDHTVRVWRVSDGQLLLTFTNHTDRVVSVTYSSDLETLISASQDGTIRFWEGKRGTEVRLPIMPGVRLTAMATSLDSQRLATLGSLEAGIQVWNAEAGTLLRTLPGHVPESRCAAFALDGYSLATAGRDNTLKFWRLSDGQNLLNLTNETVGVAALAFSGDGQYFAFGRDDGTVALAYHWLVPLQILTGPQSQTVGTGTNVVFEVDARGVGNLSYQWYRNNLPLPGATTATLVLTNVHTTDGGDYFVRVRDAKDTNDTVAATLTVLPTDIAWVRGRATGGIKCLAASPDGTILATSHPDGTIRLWRTGDGFLLRLVGGNTTVAIQLAFSPDGTLLASAHSDGVARLWRVADGSLIRTFSIPSNPFRSVAFSPDGLNLAAGGGGYQQNCHSVWMPPRCVTPIWGPPFCLPGYWSQSCSTVWNGAIKCWRIADGAHAWLMNDSRLVNAVAFSPDGATLAVAEAYFLILRRISDGGEWWLAGSGGVAGVVFSPDGSRLAASEQGSVRLRSATNGASLYALPSSAGPLAFARDGTWLATGSGDVQNLKLWHSASGAPWQTLTGHTAAVTGLAALPDTNLLVSASADDTLRLWQLSDGTILWATPPAGHTDSVEALAFSPDGDMLASGSKDATVKLRKAGDGALLQTLSNSSKSVDALAFVGSGAQLASASSASGANGSARLWQAESGALVRSLIYSSAAQAVACSPDGQTLVGGSTNGWVKLWRASDGALLRSFSNHVGIVGAVAFSTDGKTIASGGADATINLWNVADGSLLLTLLGHSNAVRALAYSPDGSRLASASWDGTVKLWSVTNYTPPLTLTGHTGAVNGVAFSADGRTLISVSEDRTLRFWDALSGSLLKATDAEISPIRSVTCAPVGRLFAYGRSDGAVVLARNPFAWPVARLGGVASPAGGLFQFRLFGDLDCTYRLQTSSNLVNWSDWLSMVCTNVSMPVPADPNSTNLPRRFYRAVTP